MDWGGVGGEQKQRTGQYYLLSYGPGDVVKEEWVN